MLEKWAYELRPYFCVMVAAFALASGRASVYPGVMLSCGTTLLLCGLYIFRMRIEYRTRTRR